MIFTLCGVPCSSGHTYEYVLYISRKWRQATVIHTVPDWEYDIETRAPNPNSGWASVCHLYDSVAVSVSGMDLGEIWPREKICRIGREPNEEGERINEEHQVRKINSKKTLLDQNQVKRGKTYPNWEGKKRSFRRELSPTWGSNPQP